MAGADDGLHVLGRAGQDDELRHGPVPGQPVALVDAELLRLGDDVLGPERAPELGHEVVRQGHAASVRRSPAVLSRRGRAARQPARRPSALATAWFVGLALLVAGPLLGRGHLILLDFPAGPEFPQLSLFRSRAPATSGTRCRWRRSTSRCASSGSRCRRSSSSSLPIVVGGLGLYRLARSALGVGRCCGPLRRDALRGQSRSSTTATWPGTCSSCSRTRCSRGRSPARAGAARSRTRRRRSSSALWLAGLAAVSFHVAGLYALLVVVFAAAAVGSSARARRVRGAERSGSGCSCRPTGSFRSSSPRSGRSASATSTRSRRARTDSGSCRRCSRCTASGGAEFTRPVEEQPGAVPAGPADPRAGRRWGRRCSCGARGAPPRASRSSPSGSLGVLLAAGTAFPPTGDAFRWLFTNLPLARRVPGAAEVPRADRPRLRAPRRRRARAPAHGAGGCSPRRPSPSPRCSCTGTRCSGGWAARCSSRATRRAGRRPIACMERTGGGRLLVLPWWLYEDWPFTDGRIVASPAPSFFSGREVLVGRDIGLEDLPPASVDPFSYYVDDVLDVDGLRDLGRRVAPLGVRYVAWTEEAEPERPGAAGAAARPEAHLPQRRPRPLREPRVARATSSACADRRASAVRRIGRRPARCRSCRALPGWDSIEPPAEAAVSVGERCNDGWRLEDESARCHLGAVAAFATPDGATPRSGGRSRPCRLWAFAITLATLAWVGRAASSPLRPTKAGHLPGLRAQQARSMRDDLVGVVSLAASRHRRRRHRRSRRHSSSVAALVVRGGTSGRGTIGSMWRVPPASIGSRRRRRCRCRRRRHRERLRRWELGLHRRRRSRCPHRHRPHAPPSSLSLSASSTAAVPAPLSVSAPPPP